MKLLLTSAGITNASIRGALVELLGKPIAESNALCIPTGSYGSPYGSPAGVWRFISGHSGQPMTELGWKSLGVLELTALPSIDAERWISWVRDADILPSLQDTVYAGFSAGSMVLTPRIGDDFVGWTSAPDDTTLGVVDFSIFPHVDHPDLPENTMAEAERWAAGLGNPAYAIDDDTAIKGVDGTVELVTEGHWKFFAA